MEDNLTYSNLANKGKKLSVKVENRLDETIGLRDLRPKDSDRLIPALCNDLKRLLPLEGTRVLSEGLLSIQHDLENFQEQTLRRSSSGEQEIPNLDRLYKNLAPLLLRSLASESDSEKLLKEWQEGMRVAIEEEIYLWQQQLPSNKFETHS